MNKGSACLYHSGSDWKFAACCFICYPHWPNIEVFVNWEAVSDPKRNTNPDNTIPNVAAILAGHSEVILYFGYICLQKYAQC